MACFRSHNLKFSHSLRSLRTWSSSARRRLHSSRLFFSCRPQTTWRTRSRKPLWKSLQRKPHQHSNFKGCRTRHFECQRSSKPSTLANPQWTAWNPSISRRRLCLCMQHLRGHSTTRFLNSLWYWLLKHWKVTTNLLTKDTALKHDSSFWAYVSE